MAFITMKEGQTLGTVSRSVYSTENRYWRNAFYRLPQNYDPNSDKSMKYVKKILAR